MSPRTSHTQAGVADFEKFQDVGFYSLLFLAQALGKQNVMTPLLMGVVSNQLQEVTGDEPLCPEKATLLGPCKVIPQEYPNISCLSIDIVLPQSGTWQERKLIDRLIAELSQNPLMALLPIVGSIDGYRASLQHGWMIHRDTKNDCGEWSLSHHRRARKNWHGVR